MIKICAAALIFKDGEVLLGKRTSDREQWPGVWDLIGGHCNGNEAPEEALIRELSEEIDVTPTNFTHLATIKDSISQSHREYTFLVYLVTGWTGVPRNAQPHEHSEIR